MKIDTIEISGFASALTALRLPFGLNARSTIVTDINTIKKDDLDDENPLLYGVTYSSDVEIHPKDLTLLETLVRRGYEHAKSVRGIIAYAKITAPIYWWCELETYRAGHERLASNSTMHQDCKGMTGDELVRAKSEIPMGKELTKVDLFSYQCLRNIVRQRKGHRLPEWSEFTGWVKTLPFADELIFNGL